MNRHTNKENYKLPAMDFTLLGDYPIQFLQHLSERGHPKSTTSVYLRRIGSLVKMMKADGLTINDLDEKQAIALIAKTNWVQKRKTSVAYIAKRFVRFLAERGAGKLAQPSAKEVARAELKKDYETFLRHQRGLTEKTIFQNWRVADRFLEFRFSDTDAVVDVSRITPIDIARFLQHLTIRQRPLRDKTLSSNLRNFFRYLFRSGKTRANLALSVPKVAQRYGTRLPRHLTTEQVELIIGAVRTETITGRRDYAMMLLLARLGLRAPEVIAMQLDDIDWRSGEIIVRGKGKRHDRVPLPPDVGKALADYIKTDRKTASRALFVSSRAPHDPFKDSQILNFILRGALAKTGLKPPAPYVGSHLLRHSLATNLVQRGASLDEIGNLLRHRSRASTMIYAKLDIDGLRSIAQSWPGSGGAK